jgi:methionine-rich copper-binding protein CopC
MFYRGFRRAVPARIAVLMLVLMGLNVPGDVLAHAIVVSAKPQAKAHVPGPDVPIDLEFNSRVDASRSRLAVLDDAGTPTPLDIDPTAPANHLRAAARGLADGSYVLEWYVLSTDGHITRGRLKFDVSSGG